MAAQPVRDLQDPMTIAEFETMEADNSYRTELVRGYVPREPPTATCHGVVATRIARCLEEHNPTSATG